jgi:hypothetical protein
MEQVLQLSQMVTSSKIHNINIMYKLLLSIALFFSIVNVKAQKEKYNMAEDSGKIDSVL